MKIEVKLYGTLRRHRPQDVGGAPHHPFVVTLPTDSTVQGLIETLSIPEGLLNAASVNKNSVELNTILRENDHVSLFPPTAGG